MYKDLPNVTWVYFPGVGKWIILPQRLSDVIYIWFICCIIKKNMAILLLLDSEYE